VLTDKPIGNVKKDNLVNKINDKNMLVTLDFVKNGVEYRIERGRKPNILKLFIDGDDYEDNKAHGEMKDTQEIINDIIGMSSELVKLILIMTTQDEGFLSFKAAQQKSLIEELLGITLISEKADQLKTLLDNTKIAIDKEQFKLKTYRELNEKTIKQINNLELQ
jgi:DNA repair exonuclease SbcCD ATPase subunit